MFKKLKNSLGFIGAALAALWLYLTAHKKGRAKGQQEMIKEVNRAEKQRHERQQKIDGVHNEAVRNAMDVDKDNTVDSFNQLFNDHGNSPKK